MEIPDFPPNNQNPSDETKDIPKPEVKRVTKGRVLRQKKKSNIFTESVEDVFNYVVKDVVAPRLRDMVVDSVIGGVERAAYGDARPRRSSVRSTPTRGGHVSYNRYSSPSTPSGPPKRNISRAERARHDFDNILLETRQEADDALDSMYDLVRDYGSASVSDLYTAVGIDSTPTDTEWGWTSMSGSTVRRVRSGYLLDLPATEYLK